MTEKKRLELHFHWEASDELDVQTKVAGGKLRELAEALAGIDSDRPEELHDMVERKHVQHAAERLFEFDPSLMLLDPGHAVFLSYSTKDEDFARELEADLRQAGVKTFLAPPGHQTRLVLA